MLIKIRQAVIVQKYDGVGDFQALLDAAMQSYGPRLGEALVRNFTGEAARSDLDFLVATLKKLVVSQPKAKTWMGQALDAETGSNKYVGDSEKRVWLQKVFK